jgi:hypothetical protein
VIAQQAQNTYTRENKMIKQTTPATPDALILQTTGKLAEATEVIKQLVDDYDAGTLELDNEAVVTKARAFLDGLK